MKKAISLYLFCLISLLANAQPANEVKDFTKWTLSLDSSRYEASKLKDYPKTIALINQWIDKYDQLPTASKKKLNGFKANMYYNLACYYALTGEKSKAFDRLKTSVDAGYDNYNSTMDDSDLNSLHQDPEFKEQILRMRGKNDYSYILTNSGRYNNQLANGLPKFTYQSASAPELVAFKTRFNLDSVSGNGDEVSKLKNLLYWAHNVVRHDGNSVNPQSKNAIDLIAVCKKDSRGVNCRMMATILRDAYQAEGFKARMVTCMPKDTADFDCHVITVVWSKALNKWVWMDPTFNAYVSDKNGNLLNIEEVRERMVSDKPWVLNEGANWNNNMKETRQAYFRYMSKNLYWLQCASRSEWDVETNKPGKHENEYLNLYPGNFTTIYQPKKEVRGAMFYATNNPGYFWQKPQGD